MSDRFTSGGHVLPDARADEFLGEVLARRRPVEITCRTPRGWATTTSRLLEIDAARRHLVLDYPSRFEHTAPEIVGGQTLGLAFKVGYRRCVCEVLVRGRYWYQVAPGRENPALKVFMPASVHELQRRLYYRSPVPRGQCLSVNIWHGRQEYPRPSRAELRRAALLDVSAGGLAVTLPVRNGPTFEPDEPLMSALPLRHHRDPICLSTRCRSQVPHGNDQWRIGLEFVGLATSPGGRRLLRQISEMAARFHRMDMEFTAHTTVG